MSKKTPRPMLTLTGQRLYEIRSGFLSLKEKRLPNGDTEALVASIYQLIRPSCDAYMETLKKIERDLQNAELLDDPDEKLRAFNDAQQRLDALNAFVYEVPAPRTKLTRSHLPKQHKGKDGEMNPQGNAGIMIALGSEFFEMPDEPGEDDTSESSEEDDD